MTSLSAAASRFRPPPTPPTAAQLMARAGLTPDGWQRDFLDDRPDRALRLCSRQAGKSTVTAAAALHEALSIPGSTTLLLSPSQRQSAELLSKVRQFALAQEPAIVPEQLSVLSLRLRNGSRVISLPGRDHVIRGFTAQLIVIDEAAWVPSQLLEAVRPMLAVSAGRLVAMSTPHGRRGWFYEAWSGAGTWRRTKVTADEISRISPEFLAEERASLPASVFAAEYFCSFEEAVGAVFSSAAIHAAINPEVTPLWS